MRFRLPTGSRNREILSLSASLAAVAVLVWVYVQWFAFRNPTIAALSFLLVVFVAAAQSPLRVAIVTSVVATGCFNFFFLPPYGTFRIADPQNWFELFTLLVASVLVSRLSAQVRERAEAALVLLEERKEAEIARRGAELRSALLASLSHDLRTPLTAVTVASNNLQTAELSDREKRGQVDVIRTEVDRLNRLFTNLVEMARIETHAVTTELAWVQPSEIVETARQQVGPQLGHHPLTLDLDECSVVKVDPRLTSAAVAHLLENAAQYSPDRAPIEVRAWQDDGELRIAIRDHGPGLGPSDLSRVFDRFYRGASGQQRFGTGMGLAITRGLLAAEGGRVWAENDASGGARFTLAIPADSRALATADEESA